MQDTLTQIEHWIEALNRQYAPNCQSCTQFSEPFAGFYSPEFLAEVGFVLVDEIPRPDLPALNELGLDEFLVMEASAITFADTYYVRHQAKERMSLHFHELVHVLQWRELGVRGFIERYITELLQYGYRDAPLEKMAYTLDTHFSSGGDALDVATCVQRQLQDSKHD